jgi:hypothetical protein
LSDLIFEHVFNIDEAALTGLEGSDWYDYWDRINSSKDAIIGVYEIRSERKFSNYFGRESNLLYVGRGKIADRLCISIEDRHGEWRQSCLRVLVESGSLGAIECHVLKTTDSKNIEFNILRKNLEEIGSLPPWNISSEGSVVGAKLRF